MFLTSPYINFGPSFATGLATAVLLPTIPSRLATLILLTLRLRQIFEDTDCIFYVVDMLLGMEALDLHAPVLNPHAPTLDLFSGEDVDLER